MLRLIIPILCLSEIALAAGAAKARVSKVEQSSQTTATVVGQPVLGYLVQDEVRAITGVPGASRLSVPLAPPPGATSLFLAPRHYWALAIRDSAPALAWNLDRNTTAALDEVWERVDLFAFSPSGAVLAMYWREGGRLVVYEGLPESPKPITSVSGVRWPVDLDRIAVSEAGVLAGATRDGLLLQLLADSSSIRLYETPDLADFCFVPGSGDIAVADRGQDRVVLIERSGDQYASRVLLDAGSGLERPSAIAADSGSVLVATSGRLVQVDSRTMAVREMAASSPARFERMRLPGLMLTSSDPVAIIETASDEIRTHIVPAPERPADPEGRDE